MCAQVREYHRINQHRKGSRAGHGGTDKKQQRLAYVARRYYLDHQKQSDIAKEMGFPVLWSAVCCLKPERWEWWRLRFMSRTVRWQGFLAGFAECMLLRAAGR